MKMKNNKKMVLLIIYALILIIATVGATFAYFTATATGNGTKMTIKSASIPTAYATGTNVVLNITGDDMLEENSSNLGLSYKDASDPGTLTLDILTSDVESRITCTYDILYNPVIPYIKSSTNINNLKEFTIFGNQTIVEGEEYTSITGSMAETDLANVTDSIKLVSDATFEVSGTEVTGRTEWQFIPRFYNLEINQDDNVNKTFGGYIEVGSLTCVNNEL